MGLFLLADLRSAPAGFPWADGERSGALATSSRKRGLDSVRRHGLAHQSAQGLTPRPNAVELSGSEGPFGVVDEKALRVGDHLVAAAAQTLCYTTRRRSGEQGGAVDARVEGRR